MKRLPVAPLTDEDCAIWCEVYLRAGRRPEFGVVPAVLADRSDAAMMLDNVLHQVSAVIRVESGDWGYWIHNSVVYRGAPQ